jgi:hypothetical protein
MAPIERSPALLRFYSVTAALLVAFALPTPSAGQTTQIDTRTGAATSRQNAVGHYSYGAPFGDADVTGWGQTFRAPGGAGVLDAFSFFLNDFGGGANPDALRLRGYVVAWDAAASRPTGEILWRSAAVAGSMQPSRVGTTLSFAGMRFDVGGLALAADRLYLAFVTSAGELDAESEEGSYQNGLQYVYNYSSATGYRGGSYTAGNLVRLTWTGREPGALDADGLAGAQVTSYDGRRANDMDAAFTATFEAPPLVPPSGGTTTDMPAPASLALVALGLAGVRSRTRRRTTI